MTKEEQLKKLERQTFRIPAELKLFLCEYVQENQIDSLQRAINIILLEGLVTDSQTKKYLLAKEVFSNKINSKKGIKNNKKKNLNS